MEWAVTGRGSCTVAFETTLAPHWPESRRIECALGRQQAAHAPICKLLRECSNTARSIGRQVVVAD